MLHSNQGLIDHGFWEQLHGYLWQPLFRPELSDGWMRAILLAACALCLPLAFGFYPRVCAGILYLVACCSYRWNFQVISVDDALLHFLASLVVLQARYRL